MSVGRVIKARVFLEGVEIPAYRVTVQAAIGGPAVASIDVPPSEKFFERYDEVPPGSGSYVKKTGVIARSLVHVFYEDSDDVEKQARLLFEGELVRFDYAKETSARRLTITARDTSNLLSSTYVRYYTDFFTPYGNLVTAFAGIGTQGKPDPDNIRMNLLNAASMNPEIASALSDDKVGAGVGASFRAIVDKAFKTNSFYANFDSRTKISRKIAALVDRKSRDLINGALLESLARQNMSNLKESATIWDLFSSLMSLVFYYPAPLLAPPYIGAQVTEEPTGASDSLKLAYEVLKRNTTVNLLLKPYTWWTAPPTFNVIFPCQYKTFTLSRDFLSEPTRIIMSAFGIIEAAAQQELVRAAPSQYMFIAPAALAKKFNEEAFDTAQGKLGGTKISGVTREIEDLEAKRRESESKEYDRTLSLQEKKAAKVETDRLTVEIAAKSAELQALIKQAESRSAVKPADQDSARKGEDVDAQTWNRNVLSGLDDVSLASREDHKGIVFGFDYLAQTQVELTKAKAASPKALKSYLSNVANYKLAIQQHRPRTTTMALHFSPNLVPGFPALVVDPNRNFFGEVESVTHSFDAAGLADTNVQLSFVRGDDVEFTELSRSNPDAIQFPKWINEKYLPSSVGDSVYKVLFPKNGKVPAPESIMAFGRTQQEAAREIRRRYYRSRDDIRFADAFTRRNVASIDQAFGVLGAQKVNPGHYVMDVSSSERRTAVLEYAAEVSKVAILAVADTSTDIVDRVANPSTAKPAAAAAKPAETRVAQASSDQQKEIEVRSASGALKQEIVTRFTPPAAIPPPGKILISRSDDGLTLTSSYEDLENILLDNVTVTSESGDEISYVATSEYYARIPGGSAALLARAEFSATIASSGKASAREDAFLAGLEGVHAAVLSALKKTRLARTF